MQCYRITPNDTAWSKSDVDSVSERELFSSAVVRLREYHATGKLSWQAAPGTLYLLTAGAMTTADGTTFVDGDLYWCNTVDDTLELGDEGATFYCIEALQGTGVDTPTRKIISGEIPWENFDDPAGRPTQPVQVLLEGGLSALRTRFVPSYIAGEHWHDFDTLYFIRQGRMQFGDEGWFERGEIRAVHGGHSYGPERPGTEGVEFVLISIGGPVNLHWSDLEPPPPQ